MTETQITQQRQSARADLGTAVPPDGPSTTSGRTVVVGTLTFALVFAAALTWAKWIPYWHKLGVVAVSHSLGLSILSGSAGAPPAPSWRAAIEYATAYGRAIWPAMVAGLLIASAVEALLPQRRLLQLFQRHRGPMAGTVAGGLLAMPSMMCTCCAAPVAVSIRRRGVHLSSALSYWLSNPVLNPATLAFMAFVLPWQFVTVRVLTGVVLVFGVTMLVGRLDEARSSVREKMAALENGDPPTSEPPVTLRGAGRRFVSSFSRLALTLIPEYLVVVLLLGGFRGWLFAAPHSGASLGLAAVVLFAVVGTLFVIPTAGEIPIIQGLAAAGVGLGPLGALVLTLPALSLPSMLMVRHSFPPRSLVVIGASVAVLGVVGAALLVLLS